MIVKFKFTITQILEDDTENYEGVETAEQLLEEIKKYVADDPSYILDGLDNFTVQTEIVKE